MFSESIKKAQFITVKGCSYEEEQKKQVDREADQLGTLYKQDDFVCFMLFVPSIYPYPHIYCALAVFERRFRA